jgi:spore coat protein CotF
MTMQGNNQQPNKISDFDLMTELNQCIKQSASQLTTAILESSNPQVRQQMQSALQRSLQHHQQLSQLMTQKGYYKPLPADQQMLQVAQEQIEMANAQVGGTVPPGMTQHVQPGGVAPTVGTGPISIQRQ